MMALSAAFLLGLAGSLHCAGMCGPLVLALPKIRPGTTRESTSRVCYHLGRMASYCLLGLVLGFFGHAAALAGFQRSLSILLGVTLLASLSMAKGVPFAGMAWQWVALIKAGMGGVLRRNSLASQAIMGALNGLLPCGLVYVAAAGAVSTGDPFTSAAYMTFFGLGTWPMMLGIHFSGQRLPTTSRLPLGNVTRIAVVLMAVLLILRGLELGIPFVSPNLPSSNGAPASCH